MLDKELYLLETIQYEDEGFGNCIVRTDQRYLSLVKNNEELKNKITEILIQKEKFNDGTWCYSPLAEYDTDEEYLGVDVYAVNSKDSSLYRIVTVYGKFKKDREEYVIDFSEMDTEKPYLVFYDYDHDNYVYKKAEYREV